MNKAHSVRTRKWWILGAVISLLPNSRVDSLSLFGSEGRNNDDNSPPLMVAAQQGDLEGVHAFLESGVPNQSQEEEQLRWQTLLWMQQLDANKSPRRWEAQRRWQGLLWEQTHNPDSMTPLMS